jgi:F420-0:gamma-glutamyl ligase
MQVRSIKTHKITAGAETIDAVLDRYLPKLEEKSVVAISSKIVAICEGSVVAKNQATKDELIIDQADLYLPRSSNKHGVMICIRNNQFVAAAGIDESNGDGYYILWPQRSRESAHSIEMHLKQKHKLKDLGVIITDSASVPLQWGAGGICIGHSGFNSINNYAGKADIFGRPLAYERSAITQGLASSAVVVMGEGAEQTPLAVISDLPFVEFTSTTVYEPLLPFTEDLYAPLLTAVDWQ